MRWLAALPFAAIASPVRATDAGPFVGTWSGIDEDDTGRAARFRFVIAASGGVTVCLIDGGPYDVQAKNVEFKAATISFELPTLGVVVRGSLAGGDRIEATIVEGGKRETVQMVRGDLYPVKLTILPPGPMTAERLRRLLLLSNAPAMAVGWAFKQASHTVLVDGVRSLGATARVERADAWHIGSDTKSMTATLVARLIEADHLKWTTTVGDLLAQAIPTIRTEYRQATLIDLLSHHAGLPRDAPMNTTRFTVGPLADVRAERLAYVRLALAQPPIAAPRTTMNYSNAGYIVVGAMIEQAMGAPWETLMRACLFEPLRMHSAGFGPPTALGKAAGPVGHALRGDGKLYPWTQPDQADLPAVYGPAGLVHVSPDDQLAYLEVHRDQPRRFLSVSTWHKLHVPPFKDGYALGWGVEEDGSLSHTGSNGMWMTSVMINNPSGLVFAGALNAATPESHSVLDQAAESALLSRGHPKRPA